MRKNLIIAGSIVCLLILSALALPLFISANTFKPLLENSLSSALGRKVEIGSIRLSIFSGSVSVDSFSVADDPAFSSSPFLSAKQLSAGVSLMPLIFSRRLDVVSLTITDPQITLLRASSGRWNYSSLGSTAASRAPSAPTAQASTGSLSTSSSAANSFSVSELNLANGTMTVGEAGSSRITKYANVNLEASNVSYRSEFPFHFAAGTPGGGTVKLDGKAGPVNPVDAALTPFSLTLSVKNVDLAATGFIDPSAGIGGTLGFDGSIDSNGQQATSKGTLQAEKVRFAPNARPATVSVNIDYATSYDLRRGAGSLTQGEVHIGKALATLTGTYDMAGPTTMLDMKMTGTAMPATDLQGVFPALGVTLPRGAALQSGRLDTALTFIGPIDNLVIAGNVNLANAKLTGFNLGGELGTLRSFAGLGNAGMDTDIQTLSAHVRVDGAGTNLQHLNLIVPAIGALSGNGSISSAGQLDCRMVATLAANAVTSAVKNLVPKSRIGDILGGALGSLTGGASGRAVGAKGRVRIPFRVTGTTAKPVFRSDWGSERGRAFSHREHRKAVSDNAA